MSFNQHRLPAEGVAFRPGALVVTDSSEQSMKRFNLKALSFSAAEKLAQCPAQWASSRLVPRVEHVLDANALGVVAHGILEEFYGKYEAKDRTRERLTTIAERVFTTRRADPNDQVSTLHEHEYTFWRNESLGMALGVFELEDPTRVTVHEVEMSLRGLVLSNGIPFNGDIDRIDVDTDDAGEAFKIVDYKTGKYAKYNPRYGRNSKHDQVHIYSDAATTALREKLGTDVRVTQGRLLFTNPKYLVDDKVDVGEAAVADSLDWFKRQHMSHGEFFARGEFPTSPSALCGWCPLVNACPDCRLVSQKSRDNAEKQHSVTQLGIPTLRDVGGARIAPTPTPPAPDRTEATMTTEVQPNSRPETAPQNELVKLPGGATALNPNSWAALRAYDVTARAWRLVKEKAGPTGPEAVGAIAELLADIILRAQQIVHGTESFQTGAAARMAQLLDTYLELYPVPFGGTREQWSDWHITGVDLVAYFAQFSEQLHEAGLHVPTAALDAAAKIPPVVVGPFETAIAA